MTPLIYDGTEDTPKVVLDRDAEEFLISGRSLPEDAFLFYKPIFRWLEEHAKNPKKKTIFRFELEYFNTSSAKQLSKIFIFLKNIKEEVEVIWCYQVDDIDMLNSGKRFEKFTNLNFKMEVLPVIEDDDFRIITE
ncbi:MAG TPA: DUF1987 domain-containing protein [Salinivirgaceae bacterium]|nr:DUF1987 domain-containing protein [Salinivirgaceae bacterium]HQA76172.1 DUF1987 domain-containing protein [Salinivirgaceae bacterium]